MLGLLVPHGRRVSVRWMSAVLLGGLVGLTWAVGRPAYYRWAVGRDGRCDVVVYCDASGFRGLPVTVLAQYDQAALSPVARALGLYQNRQAPPTASLYSVRIEDVTMTATTLALKNVPRGPLTRIMVLTDDRSFHVWVRDRTVVDGKIHVRLD
jgi:hypothetical protein